MVLEEADTEVSYEMLTKMEMLTRMSEPKLPRWQDALAWVFLFPFLIGPLTFVLLDGLYEDWTSGTFRVRTLLYERNRRAYL